jgi:pyocin large subunit-like protein
MMLRLLGILLLTLTAAFAVACQTASGASSPAVTIAPNVDQASASANPERQRWAQNASWAPGQLQEHFSKHGPEGAYRSVEDYDRAARDTILSGTTFTYVDRESRAQRLGFYYGPMNRFTSLTADGQRITTFFQPDRRDSYVRGLDNSTFK